MSNIELPALPYFIRQSRPGGAAVLHFADVGKMLSCPLFGLTIKIKMKKVLTYL
jgi:hypothetical protein